MVGSDTESVRTTIQRIVFLRHTHAVLGPAGCLIDLFARFADPLRGSHGLLDARCRRIGAVCRFDPCGVTPAGIRIRDYFTV